jgi:hypothetical protein
MHWVYYGAVGTAGKKVGVIKAGEFMCNNSEFGTDPAAFQAKACYIGPKVYKAARGLPTSWKLCATSEAQSCILDGSDSYEQVVLSYGVDTRRVYRLATLVPGASVKCNSDAFGRDPAPGVVKSCSYIPLAPKVDKSSGVWQGVISCGGQNCLISHAITTGTEVTDGNETGHSWGVTVTGSVGGSGLTMVNASASVALAYTNSASFQHSVTNSYGETKSATCAGKPYGSKLWQFTIPTSSTCLANGSCAATTHTADYFCTPNKSNGSNPTPLCLPQHCVDQYCQTYS